MLYFCKKYKTMATIAFQYDARNSVMRHLIDTFVAAGAKLITLANTAGNSPYDQKFVEKIKSQEGQRGVKIAIEDLWK